MTKKVQCGFTQALVTLVQSFLPLSLYNLERYIQTHWRMRKNFFPLLRLPLWPFRERDKIKEIILEMENYWGTLSSASFSMWLRDKLSDAQIVIS